MRDGDGDVGEVYGGNDRRGEDGGKRKEKRKKKEKRILGLELRKGDIKKRR